MIISSVEEIIKNKTTVTVPGSTRVSCVCETLTEQNTGAVLVVDDTRLRGIFTERDAVTRIIAKGLTPTETRVEEVMTPEPKTVTTGCTLVDAVDVMAKNNCRHVPVVRGNEIVGVLSMRDVPLHYRVLYENWVSALAGEEIRAPTE
ncbi:cyclic nucleotide-binding/CBS domain-containing protein [Bauldia sp.]|uniref:CBS domain-containing protein n=1 Tax=Bauldia sp. TaxID=2575872 RepID=UPI003BAA42E5